ncbi:tRNA(Met) cytidine acetyltransferase TmcA [Vibrio sp. 11986-1-5]|uniref:tRNA(Met) cytidine acetyltransferase TmcA n=1 Tax=Vibrio sp. 11986-1-5 TaxID=2211215 RepID=UPI000D73C56C|nr:GNAT family N-acetyltransferase [Vibrio sp. 11986-1-5]PXA73156.1 tRNA cytosine(34) acetyltransferase TmcA [Vibrio sp. 11986-1-5]
MTTLTTDYLNYFQSLQHCAQQRNHRFAVYLSGELSWSRPLLQTWLSTLDENLVVVQLGGEPFFAASTLAYNQGQRLLGQECHVMIADFSQGFDANSFSAALGTLIGGGLLFIIGHRVNPTAADNCWLTRGLEQLLVVSASHIPALPISSTVSVFCDTSEQELAVDAILRVITGHRKRPLLLTADRGRGKSSALGIAAAKLMQSRSIKIIITAPRLSAISPVFYFAAQGLPGAKISKDKIDYQASQLRFVAPDELEQHECDCDLLLVDEAAALPLPFLYRFVERYHRAVFSTTIHGYEGCGRGFTLKFQHWLAQHRPQTHFQHLHQPIRWAAQDPLEAWHRETFLLNYDLRSDLAELTLDSIDYFSVSKAELLASPTLLKEAFGLLVNAHYQTSPNDLFHLLSDEKLTLYVASHRQCLVGCLLAVQEGGLDQELIESIQLGQRRPRGHLVPITLANQVGITEAAQQLCWRVMRIAVHPQRQNMGIGSQLLSQFIEHHSCDYIATSFGATAELIHFWQRNGFHSIKLGSQRDQASGCFSLLMVYGQQVEWLSRARWQFQIHLLYELKESLQRLAANTVRLLLCEAESESLSQLPFELLARYSLGGANYESVAVWIEKLLIHSASKPTIVLDELLIEKVIQQRSWTECASLHGYTGRKQTEQVLRQNLAQLLRDLQCKLSHQ